MISLFPTSHFSSTILPCCLSTLKLIKVAMVQSCISLNLIRLFVPCLPCGPTCKAIPMLPTRSRCSSPRRVSPCPGPGFACHLRLLCQSCGLPPDRYTPHSLHIGAATTAAASAPVSTLKAMGRWSSAAYERYLRPDVRAILDAQKAMSPAAGNS